MVSSHPHWLAVDARCAEDLEVANFNGILREYGTIKDMY
jgi:hypothetical protein